MQDLLKHIHLAKANQRKSQRILFDRYNSMLFAVIMKYMRNRQDAEEVLQETWIDIFKSLANYEDSGKFEGWIKTIAIRKSWKAIKSKPVVYELADYHQVQKIRIDQQIMDKLTCEEILKLLHYIPSGAREVFKMNVLDGYTHKEIASIMSIGESTSRAHLTKARSILKTLFEKLNLSVSNGI